MMAQDKHDVNQIGVNGYIHNFDQQKSAHYEDASV